MAGWLGRLFHRKKDEPLRCTAVVAAAGSSARMEGQDKLLLILGEQPVLAHPSLPSRPIFVLSRRS